MLIIALMQRTVNTVCQWTVCHIKFKTEISFHNFAANVFTENGSFEED